MPVPSITAITVVPSRVGDPANFNTEVAEYLPQQVTFRTQLNTVGSYLNTLAFDPFDWGSLSVTAPSKATFTVFPDPPLETDTGVTFTTKADGFLDSIFEFVSEANTIGDKVDELQSLVPSGSIITDELRPSLGTVSESPSSGDSQVNFNTKSFAFCSSTKTFTDGFGDFYDYMYFRVAEAEDFGLVSETPDETIDWGEL